ncbi:zinc ribbon domain-containing protein [Desulfurobacterium sp.]|uniref:zinc ribbon domain-containing protein n=1 Tax=Desulfurobacterium sp. TaxID=2004706 RepID=UPI0031B8A4A2
MCSVCGYKHGNLTLLDRNWTYPVCRTEHDRDINAATNLYLYGLARLTGGRVGPTRTEARGECFAGGTDICPVYEASLCEAGSSTFCKVE